MQTDALQAVIAEFKKLSVKDRERFIDYVAANKQVMDQRRVEESRFADGYECPHCHAKGKGVIRFGKTQGGRQRYKCEHCSHTFSATTGSVMYNTKLPWDKWKDFISHFMQGTSVRKTAEILGINKNTAFLWRHKICDSIKTILENVTLQGIVEADETYFRVSYKGSKAVGRKAHKRGSSIFHVGRKRGLSKEQVCVPCAVNRTGQSVARVAEVGKGSYVGLNAVLGGHIATASTICVDGAAVYKRLAAEHGLKHVLANAYGFKKGCYSIQHVNAYHSRLKREMMHFCGVSTKHLNNYLVWFNFAAYAKEEHAEKVRQLARHIMTANCYTRRIDIPKRPPIPYICEGVCRIA